MINPTDYIHDKQHGNYYHGIMGALFGLIGNIFYVQTLKLQLLFSWEGVIRGIVSLFMIGAGSLVSVVFKELYAGIKPSAMRYFLRVKRYFFTMKRKINGKAKKSRNKRAA